MDPIVHAKQKVILRQFDDIADVIATRLGLETRLLKLNIENLGNPECEIGVYTPHGHRIGAIDVLLNVANCKSKVTCALFRDLEDAVDDWVFDVAGKSGKSRRMRCENRKCATDEWDSKGHQVCLNCLTPGTPAEPDVVVQDETASAESFVDDDRRDTA